MYTVIQSGLGDLLSEGETDREDYYPLSKADFGEVGVLVVYYVMFGMVCYIIIC